MKPSQLVLVLFVVAAAPGQTPTMKPQANAKAIAEKAKLPADISVRILEFKLRESPGLTLSAVTSLPQCDSKGALFLDMLDPDDVNKHNVVSIEGNASQSYPLSAISDLHDIQELSFYPSDSMVAFVVRATKDALGTPSAGKSPGGAAWSSYHNYVAEFNRDGTYKKSVELPMDYMVSHFAVLPSGEFVVAGYDQLNSAARLLVLDSSGQLLRALDMPAARIAAGVSATYGSIEAARAGNLIMGSIGFTSYNQDVLVWQRESANPVLDVGPGGRTREVPIEQVSGSVFVEFVPANDRWIAHFRRLDAPRDAPFDQTLYSYYEVRPQDGSLTSRLKLTGTVTNAIACESDRRFISYRMSDKNKFELLTAE